MTHLSERCCSIVELRQYTMVPGRRDELIELFEREFVDAQEAVGIHVIGTFIDLDDPDRFVWMRGFEDLDQRAQALRGFYGSQLWADLRDATNATLTDSDDVLLLQPVEGRGVPETPPRHSSAASRTFGVTVQALEHGADDTAAVTAARAEALSVLRTHPGPNDFTQLPIREGEQVVVVLTDGEPAAEALPDATVLQAMRLSPTTSSALR